MLKNLISILIKKIIKNSQPKENTVVVKNIRQSTVSITQVIHAGDSFKSAGPELEKIQQGVSDQRLFYSTVIKSTPSSNLSSEINKKIDQAVNFISSKNIPQAKENLFRILGEIGDKKLEFKTELVRVYNNLGACFNRPKSNGGDYDEAIKYFALALEYDPNFIKAKINMSGCYLNKSGKENKDKAYELTQDLWKSGEVEEKLLPILLPALIWSIFYKESVSEAIKFANQENVKQMILKEANLLQILAKLYFEDGQFDEAIRLTSDAIKLDPAAFEGMVLKAFALISKAQSQAKHGYYQLTPEFSNLRDIEDALVLLESALSGLRDDSDSTEEVKLAINACSAWLNKADEAEYREIKQSINLTHLSQDQVRQLEIFGFIQSLKERNFDIALKAFIENKDFNKISYEEKHRIASIFLMEGAIEQAMSILDLLENEATVLGDVQYWLTKSALDVLLDSKNLAIQNADIAKNKAKATPSEKKALAHFNAIMLRYAKNGESERLVKGMFEYDKRFPEDKVVTSIQAIDENGQLSEELKKVLLEQKRWFDNIRDSYKEQPVLTYFLEDVLKRPYVEVISTGISNGDPNFTTQFHSPDPKFKIEIQENLINAKSITMDYGALLNLSKMGMLGHLSKFNIPVVVSKKLFIKIQTELLHTEDQDLRRLWDYLRKTRVVKLVEVSQNELNEERVKDLFDSWLVDTLKIAKDEGFVFVVDDLRLLQCASTEGIKATHSLQIIQTMLDRSWIDRKMYAEGLGDLAERFYVFLSFTGEDLFSIVGEDKMKLTWRSNHLVNQLFLPGSDFKSFTSVFLKFIDMLWSTGSLPEDKCDWLKYLTDAMNKFISDNASKYSKTEDFEKWFGESALDFARMWGIAVNKSNRDELILIDRRLDSMLQGSFFDVTRIHLKEHISKRMLALKKAI